jgi:hypothetical protein
MEPYVQPAFQHLDIIIIIFHFQAGPQEIRVGMYWNGIVEVWLVTWMSSRRLAS